VKRKQFFKDIQDHPAPRLDTYEQAAHLYLFGTPCWTGFELLCGHSSAARSED